MFLGLTDFDDVTNEVIPDAKIEDLDPAQIRLLRTTLESEGGSRELVRQGRAEEDPSGLRWRTTNEEGGM